ncbi:protein of unknown function DUF152 [Desulfofarcimen acetoxidans DSM 771]|uniref:Purine nucleoside phosphorylase n=1 Tax=Desulfofarcimen acetoxidans (strain ATCC 49208 / DSM 771 / KCTC 5769 / VKM B-1644 / 5575) TaxID=485916 RepID=C8W494_DESAS|nr:peptidoglycan editing factor PgeF [Desulfofarcimen acetoxidans]ACV61962.1 protein of unknown function DUF152 [Desulfofarcimen acetoxidans DSM 771]
MSDNSSDTVREDLEYYSFKLLEAIPGLVHAFTTRRGGISEAEYKSLNMAFHVGDSEQAVLENRSRVCSKLGLNPVHLVAGQQTHDDLVAVVGLEHRGAGALSYASSLPGTDALITNQPGVPLSSYYADCVPLFIVDPVKSVIGLAHAGWRGTVLRIAEKTVKEMRRVFGSRPVECLAVVGPSIGPCCYEVDSRVTGQLQASFPYWSELVEATLPGKYRFDLWQANYRVFLDAGLRPENIYVSKLCTGCNTDIFYSYRAENGHTGRMASLMMLR